METPPGLSTSGQQSDGSYLQNLLRALQLIHGGDFSVRMPGDSLGIEGKIADTLNEIVAANQQMAQQLELVGQVVGRDGKNKKTSRHVASPGRMARNARIDQRADR